MFTFLLIAVLGLMISKCEGECDDLHQRIEAFNREHLFEMECVRSEIKVLQESNLKLLEEINNSRMQGSPVTQNLHSIHGCVGGVIEMSCSGEDKLLITDAFFGEYARDCGEGCCIPHPTLDCVESMQGNSPSEWLKLKETCDGNQVCTYEYVGLTFVNNCTIANVADYVNIMYSCLPGSQTNQIGFTVYTESRLLYSEDEIFLYEKNVSNIGGFFNMNQSHFICPYSGMYVFYITVEVDRDIERELRLNMMIDGMVVIRAIAGYHSGADNLGSNSVVTHCSSGQRVWMQVAGDNQGNGNQARTNTFSGFILYLDNVI